MPLSPADQHGRVGRSDARDQVVDLLHRRRGADELSEPAEAPQLPAQAVELALEAARARDVGEHAGEPRGIERLGAGSRAPPRASRGSRSRRSRCPVTTTNSVSEPGVASASSSRPWPSGSRRSTSTRSGDASAMLLRASSSEPARRVSKPSRRASAATLARKSSSSSTISASSFGTLLGLDLGFARSPSARLRSVDSVTSSHHS